MFIPEELKKKLPPGLDQDLQEEFADAVKYYANDRRWRDILKKVSKYDSSEKAAAVKQLENNSMDELNKSFALKLIDGSLADKLLECIHIYDQQPW
ncbi:MAG: hypothetical protein K9L17_12175 [Clostridiales bacterium]|nr:hypothetical protein [Clostridiales bacterium]MCF8023441.1 hypothetical protein [Clostridiales bacterium]